ncbi:MAG: tetratricopeptide repeat protein [Pseudanabaena sp.]
MQILYIELHPSSETKVELRYQKLKGQGYEKQILRISDIEDAIALAERDIYVAMPDPVAIGKKLFGWLDGDGRWLSRALEACQGELLVLAIANLAKLPHLPWEVLHDREGFLIDRQYPKVVPVRWTEGEVVASEPADRPLRVMFMATDPEGVEPRLNFEGEEGRILDATRGAALTLRVEESGCVSELKKTWRRYGDNHFDVFHLTGHASIADDGQPFFITETETGDRYDAKAGEIVDALRFRLPRLVFLSGCRTGQAGEQGATPSMAEALLNLGLTAVLGWGRPIGDDVATLAAACLYESLASANSLVEAIAATYQKLREKNISNWYLLRLYGRGKLDVSLAALVLPMGDRLLPLNSEIEQLFLDPDDATTPRVVRREDFVGRRRILQSSLRRLQGSDLGVLLHGMGGLGKTTVAKRLLERIADPQNSNYDTIFNYKQFDEGKLLQDLARNCTSEAGHEILNGKLPLMQKLTKFLKEGMNDKDRCLMFVLDDFEVNLEENAFGAWVLKYEVVEPLMALVSAIARSGLRHRLIVTCRYDFNLPDVALNARLFRVPLFSLRGVDLKKKCDRLAGFQLPMLSREDAEPLVALQKQAIAVADGNPRLLEWLAAILPNDLLTEAQKQEVLERMAAEETRFRENIMAQALLDQQSEDLRQMLALGSIFEIPVPHEAIEKVCVEVPNLEICIKHSLTLGLMEIYPNGFLRVPHILHSLLKKIDNIEEISQIATRTLFENWYLKVLESQTKSSTELKDQDIRDVLDTKISDEKLLEIYRLALQAKNKGILIITNQILAIRWKNTGCLYQAIKICYSTLKIVEDYHIYHVLANTEASIGDSNKSITNFGKALELCPLEDREEESDILFNLASLCQQMGMWEKALKFCNRVIEIDSQINNQIGKSSALNILSDVYNMQGNSQKAIDCLEQALAIQKELNNTKEIVKIQHNLSLLYHQVGNKNVADFLSESVSNIHRNSIDYNDKIKIMINSSALLYKQGKLDESEAILQELLNANELIYDVESKIGILNNLATLYSEKGDLLEALSYFERAYKLAKDSSRFKDQARELSQIGFLFSKLLEYDKALNSFRESLDIYRQIDDLIGQAYVLREVSAIYIKQDNLDLANQLLNQSLNIYIESEDLDGESLTLYQIGLLNEKNNQIDNAIGYLQKSVDLSVKTNNSRHKALSMTAIGQILTNKKDIDNALSYLYEARDIFDSLKASDLDFVEERIIDALWSKANILHKSVATKYVEGKIDEALILCNQALEITEKIGNVHGSATILLTMGQLFAEEYKNFSTACDCFQKSLIKFQQVNSADVDIAKQMLSEYQPYITSDNDIDRK